MMDFHMKIFLVLVLCMFGPTLAHSDSSLSSNGVSEIPMKLLKFAQKPQVFDWMVGIRRKIHENPELGYEEFETSSSSELNWIKWALNINTLLLLLVL